MTRVSTDKSIDAFSVSVDVSPVVATLGYFPAAAVGAMHVRIADLLSHHRRSVAVHHKFPSKRRAQRMLFARLSAVYATVRSPVRLDQLIGRSFSRPAKEEPFPDDIVPLWDTAVSFRASAPFVIPLGYGLATGGLTGQVGFTRGAKTSKVFREIFRNGGKASEREVHFVRTASGRVLAVLERDHKRRVSNRKGVRTQTEGRTYQVLGMLAAKRTQPRMIEFFEQFDRITPKHLAKMDADMQLALDEAGRAKLEARLTSESGGRGKFKERQREIGRIAGRSNAIFDHLSRTVAAATRRAAQRQSERKGGES